MIEQQLRSFFAARGLDGADGRPLYSYRCEADELDVFQAQLAGALPELEGTTKAVGPITSQAFCLWAAEWWRRNHEGGPWRWENMLAVIGCEYLAPGNSGYARLCSSVGTGLDAWGRQLLHTGHGRAFLVTLACEGGLPLRLVMREQAGLRRYFKALLEEMRVLGSTAESTDEIAERVAGYLPKSLRHEVVYTLCGQLAAQIWKHQPLVATSSTPVLDLDRLRPGWRGELPLRVGDAVANALLNNLLVDASTIAHRASRRIRWVRSLVRVGQYWELEGGIELPRSFSVPDFLALFSPPNDEVPRRFDLALRTESQSTDLIAIGTADTASGDAQAVRLEPAGAAERLVRGEVAGDGRVLLARDGQNQHLTDQFTGAARLSELPWVFEAPHPDDSHPMARLVGEGSLSLRAPAALVAIPEGATLAVQEGSDAEATGSIRELARSVYRFSGTVQCRLSDGGSIVIRTNQPSASGEVEYRLRGAQHRFARAAEPVFVGVPRLIEQRESAASFPIPVGRLQWKAEGGSTGWVVLSSTCFGDGRIRYVDSGQVRFSARVKLLPEGTSIKFLPASTPDRGVIELSCIGARDVTHSDLLENTGVMLRRLPDLGYDLRLELSTAGPPPPAVKLMLQWRSGQRLCLAVPFPSRGSGFEAADGGRLANGALVSYTALSGIRAVAMVPRQGCSFTLEGRYRGRDALELGANRTVLHVPMAEIVPGRFEVDLGVVQSWVTARLDASTDEDARVRLAVYSNDIGDVAGRVLDIARHDITLALAPDDGVVRLSPESLARLTPTEVESFRVEAFLLRQPERAPLSLERYSNVTWLLPEVGSESGPWMIVGWHGDWGRAQPCRWDPRQHWNAFEPVGDSDDSIADGLTELIAKMAGDLDHPEWPIVDGLIDWTEHLAPVCFPRLRALARNPAAMAVAALRLSDLRFERFWTAMETLPFTWQLVPRSAWEDAVETMVDGLRHAFNALGDAADLLDPGAMLRKELDGGIRRVTNRLGCLQPVLGAVRARTLGCQLSVNENAILRPEIRALWRHQRHQLLSDSGVTTGGLEGVPRIENIGLLYSQLPSHPEISQLWVRQGLEPKDRRFSIANAPLVAALVAISGTPVSRLQLTQLRAIRELERHWFDESYDLCYLCSLGILQASHYADAARTV